MRMSSTLTYGAAAILLAIAAAIPLFVTQDYLLYILSLSLIGAITAVGLNISNGYVGILNLSAGGQVAVGAYICALGALHGLPVLIAVAVAVVGGCVVAGTIFLLFSRLIGFFMGLATIAAAETIRLLVRNFDGVTNGVRGLRGYPKLAGSPDTAFWLLLAILVVILIVLALLIRSPVGLRWRAIRENRGKALSIGVPVWRLELVGFVLSGAVMALGGALLALHLQYIEPGIAGLNTLVQTILMVALGGAGTLLGPLVGALAITLVPEFLRVANELRLIIYGTTLIVVVLAIPGGIVGAFERYLRGRRRIAAIQESQKHEAAI